VDKDGERIKILQAKNLPIFEDGLLGLLHKNIDSNSLRFSANIEQGLPDSDVIMIAVGTPLTEQGCLNLNYVDECVDKIAKHVSKDVVVVVKSTVAVGVCDQIQSRLDETSRFNCIVVSNPEFLREGMALKDFMQPDRIVIGTDGRGEDTMARLYAKHLELAVPVIYTNRRTAELIKYASNTFLAIKVGFINEIADFSEKIGGDMSKVSDAMGADKRIGRSFLNPGPGFGGSCLPKDIKALLDKSAVLGVDMPIVRAVMKSNAARASRVAASIKNLLRHGETVAILGLTYKAGTDDVRDSPAITIAKLLSVGDLYKIRAFDPEGMSSAVRVLRNIKYCTDAYEACQGASLLVVLTEWSCFKNLDAVRLKNVMSKPRIYDTRAVIDKEKFIRSGFWVGSIGYKDFAREAAHSF
jgi:UDPglucose 6-dehydrogenase